MYIHTHARTHTYTHTHIHTHYTEYSVCTSLTGHFPPVGGVVEILLDVHHLNRTVENLNIPHVSVQDILKELNARLSTVRLASTEQ